MSKKHIPMALLILLLLTICAQPSLAQSGRGRQLRIAERLNGPAPIGITVAGEEPPVTEAVNKSNASLSENIAKSKSSRLIYRDDSKEHHPNRADKTAGWIMLGYLGLMGILVIASHGNWPGP